MLHTNRVDLARYQSPITALRRIQHDSLWCWWPTSRVCSRSRCSNWQQYDTFESRQQRSWHLFLSATPAALHPMFPDDRCCTLAGSGFDPHRVDYCNGLLAAGPKYTCTRSCSLSFALPLDSICSSHIVHLFLTLCNGSCTGSRCQITSDSNYVRWYTDAYTDSLLTICPISARPPRCTLIWDHLWHLNGCCQSPGQKPRRQRSAWILLRFVRSLECTPSASALPWTFVEQFKNFKF